MTEWIPYELRLASYSQAVMRDGSVQHRAVYQDPVTGHTLSTVSFGDGPIHDSTALHVDAKGRPVPCWHNAGQERIVGKRESCARCHLSPDNAAFDYLSPLGMPPFSDTGLCWWCALLAEARKRPAVSLIDQAARSVRVVEVPSWRPVKVLATCLFILIVIVGLQAAGLLS